MRIVGSIGMPSVKNFRLDSSWEKESPEADFVKVHFLTRDRVAELAGNPILNPWVLLLFLKQIGWDGTGDGSQGRVAGNTKLGQGSVAFFDGFPDNCLV